MSYATSAALQAALYQVLANDAALAAEVGSAVYDALPPGTLPDLYVTLGPETVRDRSDGSGAGALHRVTVSVVGTAAGFASVKAAAGAVSDALSGPPPALARGRIVYLNFHKAKAARIDTGDLRRIDLTYDVRVED
ncbi:DUF3168 domain-containing protein [Pelagovum pacificum]|uniref:DUF3168 domain-containing protein n=1 Tax=Pelagovum pacificum TaxID=2588711 RepID=A0A5C5GB23_9RHOB|nr:DUF3168 domain-containing protein [Pelagovum pacificum]QQA41239.1 DUF3168 domain-containing protein [Pelagovum pacificum]TNY31953.1 DUF3168 domain-containing protein [Pelagovum pacificum]